MYVHASVKSATDFSRTLDVRRRHCVQDSSRSHRESRCETDTIQPQVTAEVSHVWPHYEAHMEHLSTVS
jgi:hypothetical protein